MQQLNGEKTRKVRRTKGEGQCLLDSDSDCSTGSEGQRNGSESIRVNRDNGQGAEPSDGATKQAIIGGMIRHLLAEYREQVVAKKKELERLEATIQYFESLEGEVSNLQEDE